MSNPDPAFSITEFIFTILFVIGLVYFQIAGSDSLIIKKNFKRYLFLRRLDSIYRPFLEQYFSFYNSLDSKKKLIFEKRVQKFMDIKKFIPRGGIKSITPEMKALIAGSAIQLTFGYPSIYFIHFWRILVYPDNYYSTITHRYHKGEVNRRGIIVLSWRSFKDGFTCGTDGINLGFHEMAHALRLINIVDNPEYDFYDRKIMSEFEKEANKEIPRIKNSSEETGFFRRYSATNMDEFFAVAVECFFERSFEFSAYNPKLYGLLSKILRIDPVIIYPAAGTRNAAS